jgi:hypothetical protein
MPRIPTHRLARHADEVTLTLTQTEGDLQADIDDGGLLVSRLEGGLWLDGTVWVHAWGSVDGDHLGGAATSDLTGSRQ